MSIVDNLLSCQIARDITRYLADEAIKSELGKIRGYFTRLSRIIIIVLLLNKLMIKHSFIVEKLKTIFILSFFSLTHKVMYIIGYLLTTDKKYTVHHDHIWTVLQCVE